MTKIYLPCLSILCVMLLCSFNVLADTDPCATPDSPECITITATKAAQQISAAEAARQQAAAAAIAAEQARAAEAQRLSYESMMRARAAAEAKAIADKEAAAEKARHEKECSDLRAGINQQFTDCITPKYNDYVFNLNACPLVASVAVTTGSNVDVSGKVLGNGATAATNASTVTTTTPGPTCQQKWGSIYGAASGLCNSIQGQGMSNLPSYCKL
jgi:hypothetical protein